MKSVYILDTNVLINDPLAYESFEKNSIVLLPIICVEELDKVKKLPNEAGKNARVAIKNLDKISDRGEIHKGIELDGGQELKIDISAYGSMGSDPTYGDNKILACAIKAKSDYPRYDIILVSRDINLRVRAKALGIKTSNYEKDGVAKSDLYQGFQEVINSEAGTELFDDGVIDVGYYKLDFLKENEFVLFTNQEGKGIATGKRMRSCVKIVKDKMPWGLKLRNKEQLFATDLIMDKSIPLVSIIGNAGCGKAQPLDAKILTPTGWTTMGEVKVGDYVIGSDGNPKEVMGIYPQGTKDIYKVSFSDETSTECCGEHLWETKTVLDRDRHKSGSIKSTMEIMDTLKYKGKKNHSIPSILPVNFIEKDLPLDPYLMGALLGDGSFRGTNSTSFSTSDDIIKNLEEVLPSNMHIVKKKGDNYDYCMQTLDRKVFSLNKINSAIKDLKLSGLKSDDKFIPEIYLFNSVENRIALLQGLMDTDGFCSKNGMGVVFYSTSENLSQSVKFLVQSLGGKAIINNKQTSYTYKGIKKLGKPSFAVQISLPNDIIPFRVKRKLERFIPRTKYEPRKFITNVELIGKKEAKCIYINSDDHLYATDDFILTHNTLVSLAACLELVVEKKQYDKMVVYRPTVETDDGIGFLPGTMDEKMEPWMQPIMDNFEVLLKGNSSSKWKVMFSLYKEKGLIEFNSLSYIRGKSINDAIILIDEAQNISQELMKTILTRVGNNSKIVITGDISQIDDPKLDATNNGLTYAIEKFKDYDLAGHITMIKGERSPLATLAAEIL